jgi:hypothetical protein
VALILILQSIVCILRFVVWGDIPGGFVMAITIGIGGYGLKEDMNITWISYWGLLCFVNGTFDLVKLIDYGVHKPISPISERLSPERRFANAVLISLPIVTMLACPLVYYMYQDYVGGIMYEPVESNEWGHGGRPGNHDERAQIIGNAGNQLADITLGGANAPVRGASFRPFEGQGQKLSV